jgi:hypothetical protein
MAALGKIVNTTPHNLHKKRVHRVLVPMGLSGKNKDPGRHHAARKRRGPLKRATGPGCYDEWKAALAAERAARRQQ